MNDEPASAEQSVANAQRGAYALLAAGEAGWATEAFAALVAAAPKSPAGYVGLAEAAQARRQWPQALAAWDECLSRFPDADPRRWLRGKASTLIQLGRGAEAAPIAAALARERREPLVLALHAFALAGPGRWTEAAAIWDELCEAFPDQLQRPWAMARAHALEQAGRLDEAEAAFRALAAGDPVRADAAVRYLRLVGRRDTRAALTELSEGAFRSVAHGDLSRVEAQLAVALDDRPRLRDAVERRLAACASAQEALAILPLIPPAFDGWDKTRAWLALDERLADLADAEDAASRSAAALVRLRLRLALKDYPGFLTRLDNASGDLDAGWRARFERLAATLRGRPFPDYSRAKVFGIGLSRTGTLSLTSALETLGFFSAHYSNEFTGEILAFEDAELYDALTDTPVCQSIETLFFAYPAAKFIYTARPPADWAQSFVRLWERRMGSADFETLRRRTERPEATLYGLDRIRVAMPLYYQYPSPLEARAAYERRVFGFFQGDRADRLLVFDASAGDGWDKLCGFLGRPVPDAPYPWENKGGA